MTETPKPDPADRWPGLDRLFESLLALHPDERGAFLDAACGADEELRAELEALMRAHGAAGDFLEDRDRWLGDLLADAPPTAPDPGGAAGRHLRHYLIEERVGAGGMGVVYRATDTRLDRTVMLKFLRRHLGPEASARERFVREAKAASALDHPNICTVYEIDETPGGDPYIVMAYYTGETLGERLARGRLPVDEALDIAIGVAAGLARAHEAGIVHRDLKPANVMLTDRGEVKILDFGIAKLMGGASVTVTGIRVGTIAYMSPEQAAGEPVGPGTDIWALGVVLYEMIAGRHPFLGDNDAQTLRSILEHDPDPVDGMPGEVSTLIRGALAAPDERIPDGRRMLEALKACRRGAAPDVATTGARAPSRKRVLGLTLSGAAVAAVGVFALMRPGTSPVTPPRLLVLPFENLGNPEDAYFADGLTDEIIQRLAAMPEVRVLARTTARQVRDAEWSLAALADSLDVSYVLEGTVRWAPPPTGDSRVRVSVRFVEAPGGATLWTEPLEADFADVFELQDRIAERVATRLQVRPPEAAPSTAGAAPRAYDAFLLGQFHANQRTADGISAAATYFEQAVRIDASFARAWAELASAYTLFPTYGIADLPPAEAIRLAREAAERALDIDAELAEAHTALGVLYDLDWNWTEAVAAHERAIRLEPRLATAHHRYAEALYSKGEYAASEAAFRRALELDPLSPVVNNTLGWLLRVRDRPNEAIPYLERANELSPDFAFPHFNLAAIYAREGRWDQVRPHVLSTVRAFAMDPALADTLVSAIGGGNASSGEAVASLLERWGRSSDTPSILIASLLDALTTSERTMPWVLQAYRDRLATPMDVLSLLRRHQADPRAAAVLAELGLEGT